MMQAHRNRGFTYMLLSLYLFSALMSSAIYAVHQYVDERVRMRDRFLPIKSLGTIN